VNSMPTGGPCYTCSMTNFENGDVRILYTGDPQVVAARLHISRLMPVDEVKGYDEQMALYHHDALVPDPTAFRPCTEREIEHYTAPLDGPTRPTDVVVHLGDGVLARSLEGRDTTGWRRFGGVSWSQAGQLTTTPTRPGDPQREGLHIDGEKGYGHRLGICLEGQRQLLVATHSVDRLITTDGLEVPESSRLRELFRRRPELFESVGCLSVTLWAGDGYEGWTSAVVHDGGSLLSATEKGGDGAPSSITFIRLPE